MNIVERLDDARSVLMNLDLSVDTEVAYDALLKDAAAEIRRLQAREKEQQDELYGLDEDDSNFSQAMDDLVRQVYERVYAETKVRSDEIFERMVAKDGLAVKLMASMKECEESASQSDGEGVGVMEALLFFGALYLYETGGAAPKAMTI